jgi:hypothetical protein
VYNYRYDLNLAHGLPTPLGNLDIASVLSFQSGRYQELANLYTIAQSLAKSHSNSTCTYTIITNIKVDTHHCHGTFPSQLINRGSRG